MVLLGLAQSFVGPAATRSTRYAAAVDRRASLSALPPPFLLAEDSLPVNAFTDQVDLLDPTVQKMALAVGLFVLFGLVLSSLVNQMDSAIEKVLTEFEATLKSRYVARWTRISAVIEGLDEPERSQKLFEIMERMEREEPDFLAKIKREMGK